MSIEETNAPATERTPEQTAALRKTLELAGEFERYISKWMALESMELQVKGVPQQSFLSAMAEALSASLTKMVVVAGWSDEIALTAFGAALRDYRQTLTEQIESVKTPSIVPETAND